MARELRDVVVEGISLVSNKNKPAVEAAETGFALFKIHKPARLQKLSDFFGLDKQPIDKTIEQLQSNAEAIKKHLAK